jgi:hypothetical protein
LPPAGIGFNANGARVWRYGAKTRWRRAGLRHNDYFSLRAAVKAVAARI